MAYEITENNEIVVGVCTLSDLIALENNCFIQIPDYQRPYVWTVDKIEALIDDLDDFFKHSNVYTDNGNKYYMGSILLHKKDEKTYDVIDGQQRLTTLLILDYVMNREKSSLILKQEQLQLAFNSPDSQKNIKDNQRYFEKLKNINIQKYASNIFDYLAFSVIITKSQDDAFTFFDTQNNRGVALSPVDFLKSYHLREIKEDEEQQYVFAKIWDSNNQNQFLNRLFNQVIWRGRKWRGKNVYYENKDLILNEFQKKTIDRNKDGKIALYAGNKNKFAISLSFEVNLGLTIQPLPFSIQTKAINFPFSLRQPIEKGAGFFLFTEKYTALYHFIFSDKHPNDSELMRLNEFYHEVYQKSYFSNYLKTLFKLCVVMYYDKFEERKLHAFGLWLDYLIGSLRIAQKSIVAQTPIKILKSNSDNLLDIIDSAYLPEEVFRFLIENTDDDIYKNEELGEGNGVRERYKRQLLSYFGNNSENSLSNKKKWIYVRTIN